MRTIAMTGGTSGLGALAAAALGEDQDVRLLLGSRRPSPDDEHVLPLDLTRLDSVRAFANAVADRVGAAGLDGLVLNAGLIRADVEARSADGYETTFAVNHLAHHLLLRLLLPVLAPRAVVVQTTSGTHDPATGAGLAAPRHAVADLLAHPEHDPGLDPRPRTAAQHAYTASKLCIVLTVRHLQGQPAVRDRDVTALAYCPGQVFGTGLARDLALPMRAAWTLLATPAGRPLRRFNPTLNSAEAAGATLAQLVLRRQAVPASRSYAALRRGRLTWPDPSEQARDPEVARRLWEDSAHLAPEDDPGAGDRR